MPDSWLLAEESCQTGNDEQEVAGGSDQRERQVRSRKLTRLQQDPELFNPGLDERRSEQVDVVPKCGDYAAGAEPPCAISASEHDEREIDQRLKRVEKTDLWVKDR